jgi:hypothetical protein
LREIYEVYMLECLSEGFGLMELDFSHQLFRVLGSCAFNYLKIPRPSGSYVSALLTKKVNSNDAKLNSLRKFPSVRHQCRSTEQILKDDGVLQYHAIFTGNVHIDY